LVLRASRIVVCSCYIFGSQDHWEQADILKDKKGALEDYEKATELEDLSDQGQLLGRRGLLRLEKGEFFEGLGDLLMSLKFIPVSNASH
jgi:hypothetical protein